MNSQNKTKVIFILGPTGVGKTDLSVKLAKEFNGQIISADSVQVYKEFDIGSAKVTESEMDGIVHYGIDIVSPSQEFSASEFVEYTKKTIEQIITNGKLPIIVGGTALYVKALVEGYNFGGTEKHTEFRNQLEKEIQEKGLEKVYSKLKELAPEIAEKVDGKNKVRVIRALEILKYGEGKDKNKNEVEYEYKIFALTMPRDSLYERINKRAHIMVERGLVKEVEILYEKYGDCQPMRAIGYKEVLPFIKGQATLKETEDLISQHTRNYAKRQLTFLKGMENIIYVNVLSDNDKEKMKEEIRKWLK